MGRLNDWVGAAFGVMVGVETAHPVSQKLGSSETVVLSIEGEGVVSVILVLLLDRMEAGGVANDTVRGVIVLALFARGKETLC